MQNVNKIGGVFWTKFEHCMSKIRMILRTDARAERVVALTKIVRSDSVVMPNCASHRPFAFPHDACSVLLRVRSVASFKSVVTLQSGLCCGTNKSICACPARPVRAQSPSANTDGSLIAKSLPSLPHPL